MGGHTSKITKATLLQQREHEKERQKDFDIEEEIKDKLVERWRAIKYLNSPASDFSTIYRRIRRFIISHGSDEEVQYVIDEIVKNKDLVIQSMVYEKEFEELLEFSSVA